MEKHLQRAAIAGSLAGVLAVSTVPLQALASGTGSSTTPVEGNADGETASEHVQESTAVQSTATKDETVYVKADAEGAVEGAYAVNLFAAGSGEVTDAGTYASVKNLTTTQEIEQENGKITFDAADDEPFYYQGTLEGDVELPWDVSVAYYLDGERTSPDELAGATGRVRMEVSVEARTDAAGAGVADFANSYLVQLQGTFDTARLNVQAAEGATTAYVGNNTVVTCMALPGKGGSWTIEGDATDFSYDGWQVTALPLSLAVELADEDTAQLTDKISELESATAKLADGSSTLGDGVGTLAAGTSEVASGARDVAAGADDLASGAGNLASGARDAASGAAAVDSGAQELASGAAALGEGVGAAAAGAAQLATSGTQLLGGWDELAAGVESLQAGAAQIAAGSDAFAAALAAQQTTASDADLNSAISAYQTQLALVGNGEAETSTLAAYVQNIVKAATAYGGQVGANQALSSVSEQYATLAQGIDGVAAGVDSLATGAQSFDAGLRSYVGATSDLADGLESASAGVDAAVQGAAALAEGTSNLAAGAGTLASGAGTLASGAGTLASGAGALAEGSQSAADGAATLESGAGELTSGAAELANSVKGMDQTVIDELQDAIDEKLGGDFIPHSFVAPGNTNVDTVQFVYVLEGISEPDDENDEDAAEEVDAASTEEAEGEQSFIDRLLALFGN